MQRCPTRLIWSCFCSNRWFSSHVRMSLVISNSECIWASLASQSCVKYKVNIVKKSDKKAIIKSSSYSSSSHDPKNTLIPAFCPNTPSPSPPHPAGQVSRDGAGSSHSGIYSTHSSASRPSTSQEPAEVFLKPEAIQSCLALSLHMKFPSPELRPASALESSCCICALSLPSLCGQVLLQLWTQNQAAHSLTAPATAPPREAGIDSLGPHKDFVFQNVFWSLLLISSPSSECVLNASAPHHLRFTVQRV